MYIYALEPSSKLVSKGKRGNNIEVGVAVKGEFGYLKEKVRE